MEDLISIIVPVYNVEKYLDRCLESIVNQTYQNLEILLIDDGSTDNSGKMCDEWVKKDARLKVIHKENQGVSTARNVGLLQATGKYIGFVDSDDYIEKDMYEIMYKELKKNKMDLAICDIYKVDSKKNDHTEQTNEYAIEVLDKFQALEKFYPLSGAIWKCLFKKEKLKDLSFDTTMYTGEDLKFISHYILNGEDDNVFIKKGLYHCVQREDSVTRTNASKEKRLRFQIDTLEAIKQVRLLMIEKCDKIEVKAKLENRTLFAYWVILYAILNEKLFMDHKLIQQYYDELKAYKQYYSKKDKIYMFLFGISPQLFEIVYRNVKRLNHWRKIIGVK